ncbi:NAD-dependent deacetylase [Syntrophotalea acetylenivorans]|uniref:protein acetyllysine N-acetyltransferase n=1 Tax=Syntrophotalea acetylenivorans TaxID=1842532 RepID=A0A1L3GNK0_9BACT|nr:Sir2 family NAD-dependent protein deacetylase [Syntrophotalea acetylenivorans]APG27513.1 NAD-dependent deacetylase [Syntrophotalea acetylenivorans]
MGRSRGVEAGLALSEAKTLVITAGAGMGVDSGLPDFRGPHGFWQAYPMYQQLGIDFVDAANPKHFDDNPAFAWGFYGHRTELYRQTVPHRGFNLLRDWIERYSLESFVVTSNVDGQFQKAGFAEEQILEVHGSIHHLQCAVPCCSQIWTNFESIPVDHTTMKAQDIPRCPRCGAVCRPNILMFGDATWLAERSEVQHRRFENFLGAARTPLVVVELGAGTTIPTIRNLSERLASNYGGTLIRINPREGQVPAGQVSYAMRALEGLQQIEMALQEQAE